MKKILKITSILILSVLLIILGSCKSCKKNKLELLSFEAMSLTNDKGKVVLDSEENRITVEAIVKNEKKSTFADITLYVSCLDTVIIANEENDEYICTTTTVFENNMWVTKIIVDLELNYSKNHDGYIEVKEINFLQSKKKEQVDLTKTSTRQIDYHHHNFVVVDEQQPTCMDNGYKKSKCQTCNEERNEIIKSTGEEHSYVNGKCQYCNKNQFEESLITYNLLDNGTYEVVKINDKTVDTITIPETYNQLLVTQIKAQAFSNLDNLKTIYLPNSIEKIGSQAFEGCSNLNEVNIENLNSWLKIIFVDNTANPLSNSKAILKIKGQTITNITEDMLQGVTTIQSYTFKNWSNLQSIVLPNAITSIGQDAFKGCTNLTKINIKSISSWLKIEGAYDNLLQYAKSNALKLDGNEITNITEDMLQGVTEIPNNSFNNCTSLKKVNIPTTMQSIRQDAFKGCTSLQSITLPFIGDGSSNTNFSYIFGGKVPTSLKEVELTKGTTIKKNAFSGCTSLQSITLPETLTSIETDAFNGCNSLIKVNIKTLNAWCQIEFANEKANPLYYAHNLYINNQLIKELTFENTITKINNYAFVGANFTKITLSENIKNIGKNVFSNCINLTTLITPFIGDGKTNTNFSYIFGGNVPESLKEVVLTKVTTVESNAFYNCNSITKITLPETLTSIGSNAFYGCSSLEEVNITNLSKWLKVEGIYDNLLQYTKTNSLRLNGNEITTITEDMLEGITEIPSNAFRGITSLTSITLPTTITSIGQDAFKDLTSLTEVNIKTLASWFKISFKNEYANPLNNEQAVLKIEGQEIINLTEEMLEGVIEIPSNTFKGYTNLQTVVIPETLTSIGESAFEGCTSLQKITLPFIGDGKTNTNFSYIFGGNVPESLKEVVLTKVTTVESNAFYNCNSITKITLPETLTTIGSNAFEGCTSLQKITLPFIGDGKTNTNFSYIFGGNVPESLKEVVLTKVTTVESNAFYNCNSITKITLPETLTSIGESAFEGCTSLESITLPFIGDGSSNTHFGYIFGAYDYSENNNYVPVSLKEVIITGGKSIASDAFYNCNNITKINIPTSVTSIGAGAFSHCTSLSSIVIPTSVTSIGSSAFYDCISLQSIVIPTSVTSIGASAFSYCTNLQSIVIPTSVTRIGVSAFYGCSSLEEVNIASLASWCQISFGDIYSNPLNNGQAVLKMNGEEITDITKEMLEGVTTIPYFAFYNYTSLQSIVIPTSVTSIGESAFEGCTSLQKITLPFIGDGSSNTHFGYIFGAYDYSENNNYVPVSLKEVIITGGKSIASDAFCNCSNITKIIIPISVTSIGAGAFSHCTSLSSIVIPTSVTSIGSSAFYDCISLQSIVIPTSVTSIGASAFSYCTSLSSIVIPTSVTSIGSYAFSRCTNLQSIVIPTSVTRIGVSAFYGCSSLEEVNIASLPSWCQISFGDFYSNPLNNGQAVLKMNGEEITDITKEMLEGVTTIRYYAFYNYTSLQSIVIPTSVTSIDSSAFRDCTNLQSIVIPTSVTSIGSYTFYECSSLEEVNIASLASWCQISFGNDYSNPLYVSKQDALKLNGNYITNITEDMLEGITEIPSNTFRGITSLTSITLPTTITSIGKDAFYKCTSLQSITLPFIGDGKTNINFSYIFGGNVPESLKEVVLTKVTTVESNAFYNCNSITKITLPETLTSIGSNAFCGCSSLKEVVLTNVTTIESKAFYNCNSITKITLPETLTSIGSNAFYGCSSLEEVNIANLSKWLKVEGIYDNLLQYTKTNSLRLNGNKITTVTEEMLEGITEIPSNAFRGITSLTSITLPTTITSIGQDAFKDLTSLTEVNITNLASWCQITFTNFNSNPLYVSERVALKLNGEKITSITEEMLEGVTSIGLAAFYGCTSLRNVEIPSSVRRIGKAVFYRCISLQSITLPFIGDGSSNTHFGYIFGASSYSDNKTYIPSSLKEVIITGGKIIVSNAFYNCNNITKIIIPTSVTSIGESAFEGCTSLEYNQDGNCYYLGNNDNLYLALIKPIDTNIEQVTVNKNTKIIYYSAFYECNLLQSITLPFIGDGSSNTHFGYIFGASSYSENNNYVPVSLKEVVLTNVTTIESKAFYNCNSITKITLPETLTSIGSIAFKGCTSLEYNQDDNCYYLGNNDNLYLALIKPIDTNIEQVTVNKNTKIIYYSTFRDCTSLQSITLPFIGDGSSNTHFGYIFGASSYSENNNYVPVSLKEVIITGGDRIASYAFYNCNNMTKISLPETLTAIGQDAFKDLTSLTEVNIKTLASWFKISFKNEYANPLNNGQAVLKMNGEEITDITKEMLEGVTTIRNYAFYNYTSLQSIVIPTSVTSIGESAFEGCTSLQKITLPFIGDGSSNTHFGYIFGASSYSENNNYVPVSLKEVVLTNVTTIKSKAFYKCNSITKITLPETLTSIGSIAFKGCTSLQSIVIPTSVTSIGKSTFRDCTSLQTITIPSSVQSIGSYAFDCCLNLEKVIFKDQNNNWEVNGNILSFSELNNPELAASYLTDEYRFYTWVKKQ